MDLLTYPHNAFPSFLSLISGFGVILLCMYMSKSTTTREIVLITTLAAQLVLLGIACFTTAIGVLCIFHTRIDRQGQQLSDQGAVIGKKVASPLDFFGANDR